VETTAYKQQPDGSVRIEQTIFVETEGQKKILVGMIKDLGTKARSEMIKFLGCNVHLFLQVSPAPAPVASRLRLASRMAATGVQPVRPREKMGLRWRSTGNA
jgi:GTPase Era involved in 16S rRNA processing